METIKIKSIAIGELMCLLPILLGLAFRDLMPYDKVLPFFSGKFAERDFIIFGIPFIMAFVHIFVCLLCDIIRVDHTRGKDRNFIVKTIVPILNYIMYLIVIIYAVGSKVDYWKVFLFIFGSAMITAGLFFINTESYSLAKLKCTKVGTRQELRFNIFAGVEMIALGLMFVLNVFLTVAFSAIFIFFLFAATIITIAVAQTVKTNHRRMRK